MNIKDHLSDEMLESILAGRPSDETGRTSALHLSYCPVCRDRKDDLVLKRTADQMWRSSPPEETHVKDSVFREFWLGQTLDDELIKQISNHCIACRDCRLKRERVRIQVENERRQVSVWVLLAATRNGLRRRRRTVLMAFSILLSAVSIGAALLALKSFLYVQPTQHHSVNNTAQTNQAQNNISPSPTPDQTSQVPASQPPPPKPTPANTGELLAQAQRIDLTKAMDSPEIREPQSTAPNPEFPIAGSRSSSTLLRIVLPENSKRGVYNVSIREPAFLGELMSARGSSSDGVNLFVSIDLRRLKTDTYILRITRRDPKTNREEYLGDFNVRIIDQKSER
jgi:hypothetical protein